MVMELNNIIYTLINVSMKLSDVLEVLKGKF